MPSASGSLTKLVNVVLGRAELVQDRVCVELLLANAAVCLCHEHQLVAGDVVFLDGLRDHTLRVAVGVDVCGIPLFTVSSTST